MHSVREVVEGRGIGMVDFNDLASRHLGDLAHGGYDLRTELRVFPAFLIRGGERGGRRHENAHIGDCAFELANEPLGIGEKFVKQIRMGNLVDAKHDDRDIRVEGDDLFEFARIAPCASRVTKQRRGTNAEIADQKCPSAQFGQKIGIGYSFGTRGMRPPCRAVADTGHAKFSMRA